MLLPSGAPQETIPFLAEHGLQTASPLHRRSDLRFVGGWSESLVASQEYDLHLRLALAGCWDRIAVVDDHLAVWSIQSGSVSSNDHRVYRSKATALSDLIAAYPERELQPLATALANTGRHLARVRDPSSIDAIRFAKATDPAALSAFPTRTRWITVPLLLVQAEFIDHVVSRAIKRLFRKR